MVYGDLQFFDIIIFAAIAAFIIYRLRSVLGKRTGFQKKSADKQFEKKQPTQEKEEVKIPQLRDNEQKLKNIYKKIPSFEHRAFLEGAKKAFEIIITAFNKGDKDTLKNLVSKDEYKAFESAINEGSNNPSSQFYSLVIDGVDDARVEKGKITIGVNFISEQILSDNEEDTVKNKDTWVFEKPEKSNEPAWTLVST